MALHIIFIILIGTLVGSVLPEFGNLLARKLNKDGHYFNPVVFVIGIIGVGLALYLGYR